MTATNPITFTSTDPLTEQGLAEASGDMLAKPTILVVASNLVLEARRITGGSGVREDPDLPFGTWKLIAENAEVVDAHEIALAELHPAVAGVLQWFSYDHLSEGKPREVSSRFRPLADALALDPDLDGPEVTVGLRKLLEAKDCFVRAALPARD